MKEHGYVTLPSRLVSAVLGNLGARNEETRKKQQLTKPLCLNTVRQEKLQFTKRLSTQALNRQRSNGQN